MRGYGYYYVVPTRNYAFATKAVTPDAPFSGNRIFLPVTINGKAAQMQFDTGADLTIINTQQTQQLGLSTLPQSKIAPPISLSGIGGSGGLLKTVDVTMSVQGSKPFTTQVAIGGAFAQSLLAAKDVEKVYSVSLTGGQIKLSPLTGITAGGSVSTPAGKGTFNLDFLTNMDFSDPKTIMLIGGAAILLFMMMRM